MIPQMKQGRCCNKITQVGLLKQQTFIFSQFWRLEVRDQGLAGWVSSEASVLDLQMAAFLLRPPTVSLCAQEALVYLLCPNPLVEAPVRLG